MERQIPGAPIVAGKRQLLLGESEMNVFLAIASAFLFGVFYDLHKTRNMFASVILMNSVFLFMWFLSVELK